MIPTRPARSCLAKAAASLLLQQRHELLICFITALTGLALFRVARNHLALSLAQNLGDVLELDDQESLAASPGCWPGCRQAVANRDLLLR